MDNATEEPSLKDGYDLAVYGVEDDTFYYIHIPALVCISMSFTSVLVVLILSFRRQNFRNFFKWSKSERFVVYLALCDGGYNVFHFVDHLNIVIVKDHVRPKELCEFYGFTLAEFIMSQNLMVNVVAVNAFLLMYFNRNLDFGRNDWRLLSWAYGAPFIGAVIAGAAGQLGPNGGFCYFDGVKGTYANLFFTTVPLIIILTMNSVMYILTWKKIKEQTKGIRRSIKGTRRASARAAKTMSFFVVAFFVQWWSLAVLGVWIMVDNVPQGIYHCVTTFTNLGGVFNLIVYILMRRQVSTEVAADSSDKPVTTTKTTKDIPTDSGNCSVSADMDNSKL